MPENSQEEEEDSLALPSSSGAGDFQPTYITYSKNNPPASTPYSSSSSSQSYLKPTNSVVQKTTFRPAGTYDAATNSLYREETSKFHSANLEHLPLHHQQVKLLLHISQF